MEIPKDVPATVRPIVQAAVKAVEEVAPKATEIPYRMARPRSASMMWKLVRYAVDGENVVGVGAFSRHATMFFYRGREIDQHGKLLQGTGRDSRFLALHTPADASSAQAKRLLRKAFQLAGR